MKKQQKRKLIDSLLYGLMIFAAAVISLALVGIIAYILIQSLNTDNSSSSEFGSIISSLLPMIISTLWTVVVSLTIALPIGIMTAIYLHE